MSGTRKKLREISDRLELPPEALGAPLLRFSGRDALLVENLTGISAFGSEHICAGTSDGVLSIWGTDLRLEALGRGRMLVRGGITSVEWE